MCSSAAAARQNRAKARHFSVVMTLCRPSRVTARVVLTSARLGDHKSYTRERTIVTMRQRLFRILILLCVPCLKLKAFSVVTASTRAKLHVGGSPTTLLRYRNETSHSHMMEVGANGIPTTNGNGLHLSSSATSVKITEVFSIQATSLLVIMVLAALAGIPMGLPPASTEMFLDPQQNVWATYLATLLMGIAPVTLGMIILNHGWIDLSGQRDAHYLHFQTQQTAVTLFGTQKSDTVGTILKIIVFTFLQAMIDGFLFQGPLLLSVTGNIDPMAAVPTDTFDWFHNVYNAHFVFFISSILYGATHSSSTREYLVESVQALAFGLLAMGTQSLWPAILTNCFIRTHLLGQSWWHVHQQIEYAAKQDNKETMIPLFYIFDYDHKQSLSLGDLQRAVSYAFYHDPPDQEIVRRHFEHFQKDRIDAEEFVQILVSIRRGTDP